MTSEMRCLLNNTVNYVRQNTDPCGVDVLLAFSKDGVYYLYNIIACNNDENSDTEIVGMWYSKYTGSTYRSNWHHPDPLPFLVRGHVTCDPFPCFVGWRDMQEFYDMGVSDLLVESEAHGYQLEAIGFNPDCGTEHQIAFSGYMYRAQGYTAPLLSFTARTAPPSPMTP